MKRFSSNRPVKPLPYGVYFSTIFLLALIGLGTTLYLSIAHYRVYMDIGYKSFCAISRSINCDTVSQSAHAVLLGMPLAVWGCIGYLFVLALLLVALRSDARPGRIWTTIQLVAIVFCGFDLYLAWISTYRIKSYCIMCILTYAVNFALLYFTWLTRRRYNPDSMLKCLCADGVYFRQRRMVFASISIGFISITLMGMTLYPAYWQYSLSGTDTTLNTGHTPEGRPWIGSQSPELVIEEYSDYLCFQCTKMHAYLRDLVRRYPGKLRLVHYHYPMDKNYNPLVTESFHSGAGQMAMLALYAENHGKFWQMNDLLFESGRRRTPVGMRGLGAALDMDYHAMARSINDPELLRRLWQDIRSGLAQRITATPSFVINGQVYQGVIPAEVLRSIIE